MWWSEAAIQLFIVGSCTEKKFIFSFSNWRIFYSV